MSIHEKNNDPQHRTQQGFYAIPHNSYLHFPERVVAERDDVGDEPNDERACILVVQDLLGVLCDEFFHAA